MSPSRTWLLVGLLSTFVGLVHAQAFPSKAVTIVVPFPAGGTNDFVARTMGNALSGQWKVPVVVDNKPGASGVLAAGAVARSPADGYTILLAATSVVTHPPLYGSPVLVPTKLKPVGVGVATELVTLVKADLPAKDPAAMIALSKSREGGLNGASAGAGTLSHFGLELLMRDEKAVINHIPYKGSSQALADLMGAQVELMIDSVTSAIPAVASGKVRALAVHTAERSKVMPEVPTYAELGFSGQTYAAWNLYLVPSATPDSVVKTLNEAMTRAIQNPQVGKALQERGLAPIADSPEKSLAFMNAEASRWGQLIREAKIKP